ncbi:MAG: uncharacterized protein QOG50_1529 [Actinomycetota bacterium]|nr:uncharacterized protein [Actinomycetota bacterium]
MTCPAVVKAHHRVPLAAFGVHRVALIGDSIMEQASCSIADSLRDVGIETTRHAVGGTGLLTGLVDWLAQTRQILQTEKPDAVVAIFVGNYFPPPVRDANGAVIEADTPAFYRAWQDRAKLLSEVVHEAHARMYWVRPPPITDPRLSHAGRLYAGYQTIQADRFLSSGRVLTGPHGSEVMTKQTCGRRRVIRTDDRIHLTDDGARIYGQQIAHDLTAGFGILTAPRPC